MNANKYVFILVVAIFAAAAISAFGANQGVIVSTGSVTAHARRSGKSAVLKRGNYNAAASSSALSSGSNKAFPITSAKPPVVTKPSGIAKPVVPSIDINKQIALLDSSKTDERINAIDVLGQAKAKESAGRLVEKMGSEKDPIVRIHIANSLGSIGGASAIARLITSAKEDKSADVRASSCMSLGSSQDISSIDTLKQVLFNEKEKVNVRVSAGASLAVFFISEPEVKTVLEKVLTGSNSKPLRLAIVDNLRHVSGKSEAKYLLNIAKNDKDEEIKNLAEETTK